MSNEAGPSDGYPRDLIGYGADPPQAHWPGGARLAVNFVLNYEEGGERDILHGDAESEAFLSEMVSAVPLPGARNMSMESLYEYGSRAGVWRVLRLFAEYDLPLTVFAVGMAVERHPDVVRAMVAAGHEIASHGYRWIDYQHADEATERADLRRAIEVIEQVAGERPRGSYIGRTSPNTRRIVAEEGGFLYDADDYSDDLPFWTTVDGIEQLIVPYTLDTNDMRFTQAQGFHTAEQFFQYLRDAFDALYAEGATTPKMLSVGLHCRIVGRPARIQGLRRFLDHVVAHPDVWVTRRIDIARHWREHHPPGRPATP